MMLHTLITTDIDRTIIYSRNAFRGAGVPVSCVEIYEDAPLSFMTTAATELLPELKSIAALVPTTTRTVEQFQRIQLPGAPWRYAITSNGGNILVDGVPDKQWRKEVDERMASGGAALGDILRELRTRIGPAALENSYAPGDGSGVAEWVSKFRVANELFCYLVVRPELLPPDFLANWNNWCTTHGWTASQQGRKIYTMPGAVCKSIAVREVAQRLHDEGTLAPGAQLLAAGDGALDAEMLIAADAGIRPRHGELELLNWTHPTVTITQASEILAGEEILRWFISGARGYQPMEAWRLAPSPGTVDAE